MNLEAVNLEPISARLEAPPQLQPQRPRRRGRDITQQRKPLHPRHRGQRDHVSVRAAWEGKAGESKRPQLSSGDQRAAIRKREGASGHRWATLPLPGPCCAACGRVVVRVVEFRDHHVDVALQLQPEG